MFRLFCESKPLLQINVPMLPHEKKLFISYVYAFTVRKGESERISQDDKVFVCVHTFVLKRDYSPLNL